MGGRSSGLSLVCAGVSCTPNPAEAGIPEYIVGSGPLYLLDNGPVPSGGAVITGESGNNGHLRQCWPRMSSRALTAGVLGWESCAQVGVVVLVI
jgi:hypothetical protein